MVGRLVCLLLVLLLLRPVLPFLELQLMEPVHSFLSLLAQLLVFLERTHLDRRLLSVLFLAVVPAVGAAIFTADLPIRFPTDVERRFRNLEDHFVRRDCEIADRVDGGTSLEFWLLMHQSHVLPLVEEGVRMSGLSQ